MVGHCDRKWGRHEFGNGTFYRKALDRSENL
jgi:hypothetical protein